MYSWSEKLPPKIPIECYHIFIVPSLTAAISDSGRSTCGIQADYPLEKCSLTPPIVHLPCGNTVALLNRAMERKHDTSPRFTPSSYLHRAPPVHREYLSRYLGTSAQYIFYRISSSRSPPTGARKSIRQIPTMALHNPGPEYTWHPALGRLYHLVSRLY